MKQFLAIAYISLMLMLPPSLSAQGKVSFSVNSGRISPVLQKKIETNVSALLTAFNLSSGAERLDLSGVDISRDAIDELNMKWKHGPFRCEEMEVEERVVNTHDGLQIRNIPIMRTDLERPDAYEELVIDLNRQGSIIRVNRSIGADMYQRIINKSGNDVEDVTRREIILDYVEQFRTAYDMRDLVFLDKVFSDDALIITGKVIQRRRSEKQISLRPEIEYNKLSKSQYLERLKRVFNNTKYIKVTFRDIEVKKHPTVDGIYGVKLRQDYKSLYTSGVPYEDEGYLFLVWDFTDEKFPQILVRTWQPYWMDERKTRAIDEKDVFNLNSFTY